MVRLLNTTLVLSTALVMGATAALAAPMRLEFTGIDSRQGTTRTIQGQLTHDLDTLAFDPGFDDGTTRRFYADYYASSVRPDLNLVRQTDPLQLHGLAGTDSEQVTIGGGLTQDMLTVRVSRNHSSSGLNHYLLQARSFGPSGAGRLILLSLEDTLGLSSGIFTDPNGGLNPAQFLNWFAVGSTATFVLQEYGDSGELITDIQGTLTSMRTIQVPEPASFALVVLALLGVRVARKRWLEAPIC